MKIDEKMNKNKRELKRMECGEELNYTMPIYSFKFLICFKKKSNRMICLDFYSKSYL